jgi:hypothetical protein
MHTLTCDNLFMGMPVFIYGQGKRAVPLMSIRRVVGMEEWSLRVLDES